MRTLRWPGLVLRRMGADRTIVGLAFVIIAVAAAVLVAATAFPAVAARQGAIRSLQAADRTASAVTVTVDVPPAGADAADARVRETLGAALGPIAGLVAASGRSESYGLAGATGDYPPLTKFAFLDGLADHATLTAGVWPTTGAPVAEAVVTEAAATRLGVTAGAVLQFANRLDASRRLDVRIVGIIALADRADPVWGADPLLLDGVRVEGPFTTIGPVWLTRADLLARAVVTAGTMTWTAVPAFAALTPAAMPGLTAAVAALPNRLEAALGHEQAIAVRTELPALLADTGDGVTQAGSSTAVAAGQLLVLALYALLFVAALVVERRRASWSLLVARGATGGDAVFLALIEGAALAVPAVALGLPTGLLITLLATGGMTMAGSGGVVVSSATLSALGDLGAALAVTAGATALVAVVGFAAPVAVSVGPVARLRRTVARRRAGVRVSRSGADLALLAIAVLGLRQLGAAPGAGSRGLSPLDVGAPAVALIAGAMLSLRLTPLVARGAGWVLGRLPSPAATLAGTSVDRRSGAHARPVLLLVAAAGIAVFCVQFARAWDASQRDQAGFAIAADVAGVVPGTAGSVPAWPARDEYLAIPGVTAAAPVVLDVFDAGAGLHDGRVLAVPAGVAAPARVVDDGGAAASLNAAVASLATARPQLPLIALPAGTSRVRITVATALVPADGTGGAGGGTQGGGPSLAAALIVQERDGTLTRIGPNGASVQQTREGSTSSLVVTLRAAGGGPTAGPADPLTIVAVELDVTPSSGAPLIGPLSLTGLDTTAAADGDAAWAPVDLGTVIGAWGVARTSFGVQADALEGVDGAAGSGLVTAEHPIARPGVTTLAFRPADLATLSRTPIAAIADGVLLAAGHAAVGDTLTVRMGLTQTRRFLAQASASAFPGLEGSGFAVVDLGTWQLVGYGAAGTVPSPTAWRLTTAPGADDAVLTRALQTGAHPLAEVRSRAAETDARLADPIAISIVGTLAIVAAAALAFALLGVLAASWAAGRVRRSEVAALLALGLERRGLLLLTVLEEAFPVAVGLAGGVTLGAALGVVVLPLMIRAPGGAVPMPPPIAAVPWDVAAALAAAGVLLVAVTSLARTRVSGAMDLASTIRNDAPGADR